MRGRRALFQLGAVIGILLILAYLAGAFRKDLSTIEKPTWSLDPARIDSLTLIVPPDTLHLKRRTTDWILTYPLQAKADSVALRHLALALRDLTFSHTVSMRPERYPRYGVDTTATQIILYLHNEEPVHLYLGRPGPDPGTRFIRLADGKDVWLARSRVEVTPKPAAWIDRTVLDIPPEGIQTLQVVSPEFSYEVIHTPSEWYIRMDGNELQPDSTAFHTWIRRFHPLRADEVVLDTTWSPARVRNEATHRITFKLSDGTAYHLYGVHRGTELYLTADGRSYTYRLPGYRVSMLWLKPSSLARKQE